MKRKTILKTVTAAFALSFACGAGFALAANNNVSASAEDAKRFEMDTVAALRIGGNSADSGMRFYAYMGEEIKEIATAEGNEYGFLIFPQSFLGEVTDDYHNKISKYVAIPGDPDKIYQNEDGVWTAHGVLTGVLEANFVNGVEYTCVAWVKDSTGYTYADIDPEFSRSAYDIASAAYLEEPEKREKIVSTYTYTNSEGAVTTKFASEDYPVLINDEEDLTLIAEEVKAGATFENVNFKLNQDITLSYGYEPIGSGFAGKINGNDKTVTGSFKAEITENTEAVTGNVTAVAKTPDKLVNIATEADLISNATASQKREILSAEEWAADGVTGEYSGNALKIYGSEMQTTTLRYYFNAPTYTDEEIAEIKATYKYVNFWIAKNEVGTSFGGIYNNDVALSAQQSFTANVWKKSTITVDEYFAAVTSEAVGRDVLIYTWTEAAKAPNAVIYFGDIEFYTEYDARKIYDATSVAPKQYITQADWEKDGITGDYTGNAVKFTNGSQTNSSNYYMTPAAYTPEEIETIKGKYEYVNFWIALNNVGTPFGGLWNNTTGGNGSSTFGARNEWHKFSITVEAYFAHIEANKTSAGNVKMIYIYVGDKTTSPNIAIYFGDIEFVPVATPAETITEIVKTDSWVETNIGKDTTAPIYENDARSYYKSEEAVASLNLKGDYTGPAVEFQRGSVTRANYYIARHNLTEKQLNVIADAYTHVRFYVATVNKGTNNPNWYFTAGEGLLQYAEEANESKQFKFTAATDGTWLEFNVPVADFVTYVRAAENAGKVELFHRVSSGYWNASDQKDNFWFYFGEVEFVKA